MRASNAAAGIIGVLKGRHGYLPLRLNGPTLRAYE
jgi:hypothetical protein